MTTATGSLDRLDADVPCAKCGYNLRSQLRGGTCPECNTPVADSLAAWNLLGPQGARLNFRWLFTGAVCLALGAGILIAYQIPMRLWPDAGLVRALGSSCMTAYRALIFLGTVFVIRAKPLHAASLTCLSVGIAGAAAALIQQILLAFHAGPLVPTLWDALFILQALVGVFLLCAAVPFMVDIWRRVRIREMSLATYPCLLFCALVEIPIGLNYTFYYLYIYVARIPVAAPLRYALGIVIEVVLESSHYSAFLFSLYGIFLLYWLTTALLAKRLIKPRLLT